MKFHKTPLHGAYLVELERKGDDRGSLSSNGGWAGDRCGAGDGKRAGTAGEVDFVFRFDPATRDIERRSISRVSF